MAGGICESYWDWAKYLKMYFFVCCAWSAEWIPIDQQNLDVDKVIVANYLCFYWDNPHENRDEKHGLSTTHKPLGEEHRRFTWPYGAALIHTHTSAADTASNTYVPQHKHQARRSELGTVFRFFERSTTSASPVKRRTVCWLCVWVQRNCFSLSLCQCVRDLCKSALRFKQNFSGIYFQSLHLKFHFSAENFISLAIFA